ncbi:hypothetical protein MSAN_02529700 [Mycena sanguinolenta]|uniref:Uncharacterized protein n=1 Tax=Mycena sanguinolenta TaxID=230812 RepID=A0A8H6TWT9_9AGAR|nr:hypothetical protein MSAN_02529700 [Mycena sanguinolenta]
MLQRHIVAPQLHIAGGMRRNFEKRLAYGWHSIGSDLRKMTWIGRIERNVLVYLTQSTVKNMLTKLHASSACAVEMHTSKNMEREAYEERKTQKKIAREEKAAAIAQEMAEQQARDEAQAARRALLSEELDGIIMRKKQRLEEEAAHNHTLALEHML